ncbi:glycerophosphoryl diester phosphodiesterase membrane domain-containing protein [Enterococcus camelliae]|uniref:Glycerophosphoryl diester phosphodiesterase membrane domain-containing protein n=1 Tax=Enterococcus camelliae TaxID=453959 RepID=A0ABW5TFG9_9ENTE
MKTLKKDFFWPLTFFKNSRAYFRDVILAHLFILIIAIPGLTLLTKFLLDQTDSTYFSISNFPQAIYHQPILFLAFILLLLTFLAILYLEFSFLLYSMFFIQKQQSVSVKKIFSLAKKQLKSLNAAVVFFFLFYIVLLFPFSFLPYRSDLLAKVQIPAFILDYIFTNRWLFVVGFCLIYLFFLYLGYRLFFVLPDLILNRSTVKHAVRTSFALTKKTFLFMLGSFGLLFLMISLMNTLIFSIVSFSQFYFDRALPSISIYSAVFFMLCLQIMLVVSLVLTTFSSFYYMIFMMEKEKCLPEIDESLPASVSATQLKMSKYLFLFLGILLSGATLTYNFNYLQAFSIKNPITISHRGVSDKNGIQNTIPSLVKTSKEFHPDYVEMDVQETSDHHFIVFHDFNYNHLANKRLVPERNTLETALNLTLKENGQTGKIPTFDDYLKAAQALNQKLLIEIKTQKKNPEAMVKRFLEQYGSIIKKEHHQVQSLNYDVVEQMKTLSPSIKTGYITPFNLVSPPTTKGDFIVMEMTSLTTKYVSLVQKKGKEIYVWTPNDKNTMERMMLYGVNGIITDRMDYLNQTKRDIHNISYADKLAFFVLGFG